MLNFCSKVEKVFKRAGNVKYCSKFKKVLKKCPAPSGNAYFLAQIFKILAGELRYLNTGGSCTDQVNGYACICQPGYAGTVSNK